MTAPSLTGANLIAGEDWTGGDRTSFAAVNPRTGEPAGPLFWEASDDDVRAAAAAAETAWESTRSMVHTEHAGLLEQIAAELERAGDEIVARADQETAIGSNRLAGELTRTIGQLLMHAAWVRTGEHLEATIDLPDSALNPPRPDLRRLLVPLGPVAVFGASNFPLAFGVAGGDTASALAAGCPVIAKAHPAHPATCELVGRAIARAITQADLPPGTFSLLQGKESRVGGSLVRDPALSAVGFTGSLAGGRALYDLAAARTRPIPVYAEMGSINPVVISDKAIAERGNQVASALANSLLLGTGQFCTSPGLLFVPTGPAGDAFVDQVATELASAEPGYLLTTDALRGLTARLATTRRHPDVKVLHEGPQTAGPGLRHPIIMLTVPAAALAHDSDLLEEHFGPASLVVRYADHNELASALRRIQGSLTFTMHVSNEEAPAFADIAETMVARVGRLVWNGYPTGVAVTAAMQHGGPYPATTSSLHTSVGTTAVRRFQRPVAFQDAPQDVLPLALKDGNPLAIARRINGHITST